MKNYISKATLALLVALSATGCSDFLDEKLKSELAPDNTYTCLLYTSPSPRDCS